MSDLIAKIDAATSRLAELQKERADAEKSANAHEQAAREDRLRMTELKQEIASLDALLRHSQVAKGVEAAAVAAQKAQSEAEATLKRLAEKERQLDDLLKLHEEAATKPE